MLKETSRETDDRDIKKGELKMKKEYLLVCRRFNEPDNNTPSENIFVKILELEKEEVDKTVDAVKQKMEKACDLGVEVKAIPLEELKKNTFRGILTIW